MEKKEREKKKTGRKDRYFSHVEPKLYLIEAWCRNGDTEETIMKKLGVTSTPFAKYKREHEEF